ncbi:hypothetical protein V6N13_127636 [Hibiscus sabdariffa]|uniref:Reverse transcriptase zinc-binding domain-containing protein n=1 Tax=Hibiscus sabdariffa TaxID=183260 RepID=A0ABR2CD78_9ROSI
MIVGTCRVHIGNLFGNYDLFLWLAINQKLVTNLERHHRSLSTNADWSQYGVATESVIHALRDCSIARNLWHCVVPTIVMPNFYTSHAAEWILENINLSEVSHIDNIPWNTVFLPSLGTCGNSVTKLFWLLIYLLLPFPLIEVSPWQSTTTVAGLFPLRLP